MTINYDRVSEFLQQTMSELGYFNNLDDLVCNMVTKYLHGDIDDDELFEWAMNVDESIGFINYQHGLNIEVNCLQQVNIRLGE